MAEPADWEASAPAWLASIGEAGDWGRRHVLDAPMLGRVRAIAPARALDVGCGEGRFCRAMAAEGVATVGIDPAPSLLAAARERDPAGVYLRAGAEALPFPDGAFDLVVSYLTLIDIADHAAGLAEMARVLAPGGRLVVASITPWISASDDATREAEPGGPTRLTIARYLEEHAGWVEWAGIRVVNWHRPLSATMGHLLAAGLTLTAFEEPRAGGPDTERAARYNHCPWFFVMEWARPPAGR